MAEEKPLRTFTFTDMENTVIPSDETPEEVKHRLQRQAEEIKNRVEENTARINDLLEQMGNSDEAGKQKYNAEIFALKKKNRELQRSAALEMQKFMVNPTLYAGLSNIQDRLNHRYNITEDKPDIKTSLVLTPENELMLVIDKTTPTPFGFALRDGKITFSNTDISVEQAQELLNMLDKLGIHNIQLPEKLDAKLKGVLQSAQTANDKEVARDYDNQQREDAAPAQQIEGEAQNPQDEIREQGQNKPKEEEKPKYKLKYKEVHGKLENILTNGMGKKKGLSWFKTHKKGWDAWYVFDSEDPNNFDEDGKFDKKGSLKVKHSVIFWTKERADGGTTFGYSLPGDKKVDDNTADRIVTLNKMLGCTHIKFSGLTDADKGVFRLSCAAQGVIPVDIGISAAQAADMVKKAESKLPEKDAQLFKWRLAQQLRKNAEKDGKMDVMADCIAELEGNYNFTPFRKAYDGALKGLMEKEIKKGVAENVIGAGRTIARIFEAYKGGSDNPRVAFNDVMNPNTGIFTEEEILAIRERLSAKGLSVDDKTQMRELTAEQMVCMYEALLPLESKKAGLELKEILSNSDLSSKDRQDTIKEAVNGAFEAVKEVAGDLEAKGIRGVRTPNRGSTPHLSAEYLPDVMRQPRPNNNNSRGGRE